MTESLPHVDQREGVAVAHIKGTKNRFYEDAFRMLTRDISLVNQHRRGEIFAVFDGIGSAPEGRHSAQFMTEALIRFYREPEVVPAKATALYNLLIKANHDIFSWGCIKSSDRPKGGCAGTVAWISADRLYLFHAGDTTGIMIHDSQIQEITQCHQTEDGAIFRYFGIGQGLRMQTDVFNLEEGDRIILVSDGVTKYLHPIEVGKECGVAIETSRAAFDVVRRCRNAGVTDDITAMVIDIEEIWDDSN